MEDNNLIQNLSEFSKYIGGRICDVQGGGGNTSVKYDNFMAIKASGYSLKDLTEIEGFAVMNLKLLSDFLNNEELTQAKFDNFLPTFITSHKYKRPSMEAGLHAIIDYDYVAHTHSAYVNIFTCSNEGKQILTDIFPDSLWVEYATPGLDLFKKVKMSIKSEKKCSKIIFLQNHGLIICSDDHEEIIYLNEKVNNVLIEKFSLNEFLISSNFDKNLSENLLFPDQAIYLNKLENLALTTAATETFSVVSYLLDSIKTLGLTPNYLNNKEKEKLQSLESEKYRKRLEK